MPGKSGNAGSVGDAGSAGNQDNHHLRCATLFREVRVEMRLPPGGTQAMRGPAVKGVAAVICCTSIVAAQEGREEMAVAQAEQVALQYSFRVIQLPMVVGGGGGAVQSRWAAGAAVPAAR
jgi:hypothetical protein